MFYVNYIFIKLGGGETIFKLQIVCPSAHTILKHLIMFLELVQVSVSNLANSSLSSFFQSMVVL